MKCAKCKSENIEQMSSLITRIIFALYVLLNNYFFIGGLTINSIIVPVIILLFPFVKKKCKECNHVFAGLPSFKLKHIWIGHLVDKYIIAMLPTFIVIWLLIIYFPQTGMERIVYLPFTYLINSCLVFVALTLFSQRSKTFKFILWTVVISITVIFAVVTYPQPYGDWIVFQIFSSN